MTASDLAFGDCLRSLAGWNQTISDWQRLLLHEPEGCFVAEWEGSPAGTATTTRYGQDLAWIGMVLVHPNYRRRGIGMALLQQCLDYLQDVPCIKLDATPLGKELYQQLGFQEEWKLTRWEGTSAPHQGSIPALELHPWEISVAPELEFLDERAFGVSRRALLEQLAKKSLLALVSRDASKTLGYGMLREGAQAFYLGPVVASRSEVGTTLVKHLATGSRGQRVYWDIPEQNSVAVELAEKLGFRPQRQLLRMFRGQNVRPGDARYQFAIADPAIG
jgi:ribosomal protein S18 acetylase RimI-like enzyme